MHFIFSCNRKRLALVLVPHLRQFVATYHGFLGLNILLESFLHFFLSMFPHNFQHLDYLMDQNLGLKFHKNSRIDSRSDCHNIQIQESISHIETYGKCSGLRPNWALKNSNIGKFFGHVITENSLFHGNKTWVLTCISWIYVTHMFKGVLPLKTQKAPKLACFVLYLKIINIS